jgi:hypothetical protein
VSASFTASKERQCEMKSTYTSKRGAKAAARGTMSGHGHKGARKGRLAAYRCPWCDRWHVGHLPS